MLCRFSSASATEPETLCFPKPPLVNTDSKLRTPVHLRRRTRHSSTFLPHRGRENLAQGVSGPIKACCGFLLMRTNTRDSAFPLLFRPRRVKMESHKTTINNQKITVKPAPASGGSVWPGFLCCQRTVQGGGVESSHFFLLVAQVSFLWIWLRAFSY